MSYGFYLLLTSLTSKTTFLPFAPSALTTLRHLNSLNAPFPLLQLPMRYSRMLSLQLSSWLIYSLPSILSPVVTSSEGSSLASSLMEPPTDPFYSLPYYFVTAVVLTCNNVVKWFTCLLFVSSHECSFPECRDHISLIHHHKPIVSYNVYHIVSNQ